MCWRTQCFPERAWGWVGAASTWKKGPAVACMETKSDAVKSRTLRWHCTLRSDTVILADRNLQRTIRGSYDRSVITSRIQLCGVSAQAWPYCTAFYGTVITGKKAGVRRISSSLNGTNASRNMDQVSSEADGITWISWSHLFQKLSELRPKKQFLHELNLQASSKMGRSRQRCKVQFCSIHFCNILYCAFSTARLLYCEAPFTFRKVCRNYYIGGREVQPVRGPK